LNERVLSLDALGWSPFFAEHLAEDLRPARVVRATRRTVSVIDADGEMTLKVGGRLLHRDCKPVVGDWVALAGDKLVDLLPRRSAFRRRARGRSTEAQTIVANIDTALLMTGLDGDFNVRRIERYLTMTSLAGARAVVLLNKTDLVDNLDERMAAVRVAAREAPVHALSAKHDEGLAQLDQYLVASQTLVLLGSSGVGKSTLVNRLLGTERQRVATVRAHDSRGRHTTSARELVTLPGGALLIDTPGLRELGLWVGDDSDGLDEAFDDIAILAEQCKFADCGHISEPDCAVRSAIESRTLSAERYGSYLKLSIELDDLARRRREQQWAHDRVESRGRRKPKGDS
jgi:ribosome biogenesis GTPase